MDPSAILMTFGVILVAELGDKTQLATILLSTRYGAKEVFAGALAGISIVNGLSIALGTAIGSFITGRAIAALGASIFIIFGLRTLLQGKEDELKSWRGGKPFTISLMTIAMMELGDKTQFSILALSARFGSPLFVLLGALLAYIILMGLGVIIGSRLARRLPLRFIRVLAGTAFLILGAAFALSALGVL
ncbi:MAG: TMEM165/GDT1 family protein [Candidatus Hadarchaeales archaeon]